MLINDCAIAAHTKPDLQNTVDVVAELYKRTGLKINSTKTTVIFHPAQSPTATAPNIAIECSSLEKHRSFAYEERKTSTSKFNTGSDVHVLHTPGGNTVSSHNEASEQQPCDSSTRLLFSPPSYMGNGQIRRHFGVFSETML